MIRGVVNARREAVLTLRVVGPAGEIDVSAVIDTGFTGTLTLPLAVVTTLGLAWSSRGSAILADGTEGEFDVYAAEVEWGGSRRGVLVSAVGSEALLGMTLLAGHGLWVEVVSGGVVEIRPLP
jgi:clan AA aspartic protease